MFITFPLKNSTFSAILANEAFYQKKQTFYIILTSFF